jgi:hypothetical protein
MARKSIQVGGSGSSDDRRSTLSSELFSASGDETESPNTSFADSDNIASALKSKPKRQKKNFQKRFRRRSTLGKHSSNSQSKGSMKHMISLGTPLSTSNIPIYTFHHRPPRILAASYKSPPPNPPSSPLFLVFLLIPKFQIQLWKLYAPRQSHTFYVLIG